VKDIDFGRKTIELLSSSISGKKILSCRIDDGMNDCLVFSFDDGVELSFEYDYIYSWTIVDPKAEE